jgi:predicted outer membrane repeat protein
MLKSILRAVKNVVGGGRKSKCASQPLKRVRLMLEQLEPRDCPAVGITYTVTGLGDAGAGTGNEGDLRYCITKANEHGGADTIQFQQALTGEINPATPFSITDELTINGPGAATIQIRGANADVTQNPQLMHIAIGVICTINALKFERGNASAAQGGQGGAIENMGGTLTVNNCWFGYNRAVMNGGAIYNAAEATLMVNSCQFYENTSIGDGGAISSYGISVSITSSTLHKNTANMQGGAVYIYSGSLSMMESCQVTENTANFGGGICIEPGTTATIGGGTEFRKNEAARGGGIYMRGAPGGDTGLAIVNISNTTFQENEATNNGGGIYMDGPTIANIGNGVTFTSNIAPPSTGDGISFQLGESSIVGDPLLIDDAIIGRP